MTPILNRNHVHCCYCGSFYFPEETGDGVNVLGDPVGGDCPVCRVALRSAVIEGKPARYCGRCRGFLVNIADFAEIVERRRLRHERCEWGTNSIDAVELTRVLDCPLCHHPMDAHPYHGGGNAVIDTCENC